MNAKHKLPFLILLGLSWAFLFILGVFSYGKSDSAVKFIFQLSGFSLLFLSSFILFHLHKLDALLKIKNREEDDFSREVRSLKNEIASYELRSLELNKRTNQRQLLAKAARELGSLLDPQKIQTKLLQIAMNLYPGLSVELSHGQKDAIDSYVFQKRQPLLIPSDAMKGPPRIATPIVLQKSVVGVLRVGGEGAQNVNTQFSREDLRTLDVLSSFASLAMENSQLFHSVQQNALRDGLTGLLTHRAFEEHLENAFLEASRYNQSLSIILADIDHFKSINDTYGHQAGDAVLQGFAHIMDRNVRGVDIISRYGGEEFVILLLQTPHTNACAVANQMRLDLSEQGFETSAGVISVTSSFGVATFPEDATSPQQLLRQADQRMYKAKKNGRNQVQGRSA
jgi:diguanylate cyclase (GGDEF)-like protein